MVNTYNYETTPLSYSILRTFLLAFSLQVLPSNRKLEKVALQKPMICVVNDFKENILKYVSLHGI